ncbi:Hypothetical protein, putative [Bodo saltans]|uniref:EF-hand domain-containing protein n=1 Tax=Bodo saltans TaxID=75058 RepID=A0A0S4J0L4_BODSA|nr:Hypothetical protein, putative [Bodo saltans]|eukprot:CUG33342.1 Hypothetical protein, putative [Bodo saltans]
MLNDQSSSPLGTTSHRHADDPSPLHVVSTGGLDSSSAHVDETPMAIGGLPSTAATPSIPALAMYDGEGDDMSRQETVVVDDPNSKVNPFFYDSQASSGVLQVIKMILVGVTLFPIRIITFAIVLCIAWFLCKLMTIGVSDAELIEKPLRRPVLRFLFRKCARIGMWCLGFWWITRNGTENLEMEWAHAVQHYRRPRSPPSTTPAASQEGAQGESKEQQEEERAPYRAPILVANHSTLIDTMYLASYHDFMAVGKLELLDLPLFGAICKSLQYIAVKRESANSRKEVAREIFRRTNVSTLAEGTTSKDDAAAWQTLVIFPEATCTNSRSIIQFKLGAFVPAAPVQPMTLKYPYKHLLHGLLLRAMLQVYNSMTVEYLPIHFPTQDEKADIARYAQSVRESIAFALDVPMTDHTFDDVEFGRMLGLTGDENPIPGGVSTSLHAANSSGDVSNATLKGKLLIRDTIFNRWLEEGKSKKAKAKSLGNAVSDSNQAGDDETETIDFGTFLACTAANKIRLRMRTRRSASVLATSGTQQLNGSFLPSQTVGGTTMGSQKSFFLDEAQDEEVMYCVTLCFGSFDRDHDGAISREEFFRGMALVCPTLTGLATTTTGSSACPAGAAETSVAPQVWSRQQPPEASDNASIASPPPLPASSIDEMFDEVDTNHDGKLHLDEFVLFAKSNPMFLHHLLDTFESHNLLAF